MLFHLLKVSLRNLLRHRLYTVINILGLIMGISSVLVIGLYVTHEWSFDRYHEKADRLYRLANRMAGSTFDNGIAKVSGPWGPAAKEEIPDVEQITRFVFFGQALFEKADQRTYENNGMYADSTVFDLFSWSLIEGNARTALSEPNTIVLTKKLAEKYFGGASPLGHSLTINQGREYKVTGILEDIPLHSHFTFDFLVSMASYHHPDMEKWDLWNQFYTYLLLKPGASADHTARKIDDLLVRHLDAETSDAYTPFLQPITSIHLYSKLHRELSANSDIAYLYIFALIALIILLIACLNVINMATALAMQRSKEVGIRKVNGATRVSLAYLFLVESTVMTLVAALPAVVIAEWMIAPLNTYLGLDLSFRWAQNYSLISALIVLVFIVSLLSGVYPAFVLSSFKPQFAIKGEARIIGQVLLRKGLTVFQFTSTIFLLIGALVIGGQLRFIQHKNLGFNKENIIVIPLQSSTMSHISTIKEEWKQLPGILSVSASANRPGGSDYGVPYVAVGLSEDQQPPMRCLTVDYDFLETYQMEMVSGRSFQQEMALDSSAYLINETAARQLGWENPLVHQLAMPAIGREPGPIIGIVKDFHFRSMHDPITPLYIFIEPAWYSQLSIRVEGNHTMEILSTLEKSWSRFESGFPFNYFFFDEVYDNLYQSEGRVSTIINGFTILAIWITCLGLLGLATFITERRTKEIGIRKILGASIPGILGLLSKDVLQLVLISLVIATPLAWLAGDRWLDTFAYRAPIEWWYFIVAGAVAALIALLSISYHSIRAAVANPIKALRWE